MVVRGGADPCGPYGEDALAGLGASPTGTQAALWPCHPSCGRPLGAGPALPLGPRPSWPPSFSVISTEVVVFLGLTIEPVVFS